MTPSAPAHRDRSDGWPLVSVIIDNYNYGHFIAEAIDSALAQTWSNVEVVVVDDGSTDTSREVIATFGDRVVPVFQENGGQGSAFNAGFAVSTGDVVIFLDSDDVMHPQFAALAAEALIADPEAGLVQFRFRVVDAQLQPMGNVVPPSYVALAHGDVSERIRRWQTGSSFAPGGGVAIRRELLEHILPVSVEEFRQGVDFVMVRAAALSSTVVAIDQFMVDYRMHTSNDSNRATLSLDSLRRGIVRQLTYGRYLQQYARERNLPAVDDAAAAADPLFLSQRLVSLRVDPAGHPIPTDARLALMRRGVIAAWGRRDVGLAARAIQLVWFVLMACAPQSLATRLGESFVHPSSRGRVGHAVTGLLAAGLRLRSGLSPRPRAMDHS